MRRAVLLPAIVLLAVSVPACRRATPLPAPTAALAPSATAMPSPTPVATVDAPFVQADGLWGLAYLPAGLRAQALDERLLVLAGPQGTAVAAVDSYLGDAGISLVDRARQALLQVFGPGVQAGDGLAPEPGAFWQTGLRFTAPGGVTGEALYAQPFRDQGDDRVYGLLYAWDPSSGVTQADLEALRGSFKPVALQELIVPGTDERLQLAYSHGLRGYSGGPGEEHFLAIYDGDGAGSRRLAYATLASADYIHPTAVRQVQVCNGDPPTRLWLEVESGAGAHGGCYDLFVYDWEALQHPVSHCNPMPHAGRLADIDGDGSTEVILDETDAYVFCYACGVRYPQYRVLRCDGSGLVELSLVPLPETAPAELRRLGDRAVTLAEAGLWQDAEALAAEALALGLSDPTWLADAGLIRLHARNFRAQAEQGSYPLLENAFYGDYAAVLDLFRPYSPEEIWGPGSPLVLGTVAEGWEGELGSRLQAVTTRALQAEPDLAAACFLRGWAVHLLDPAAPQALADVRRAADLAPDELLFAQGVAYLEAQ